MLYEFLNFFVDLIIDYSLKFEPTEHFTNEV